jgi:Tfp pilus assembly protein PilN
MMSVLRLDYQRPMRPFPWAGTVLLAAALAVAGVLGARYAALEGELEEVEARAAALERAGRAAAAPASPRDAQALAQEIKQADEVLRQLALPWESLFRAVEACDGQDVALLALEPDAAKAMVKLSGEAKNFQAVLDYVRRLEAQPVFRHADLQSHQLQQQDRERPMRFVVLAGWRVRP